MAMDSNLSIYIIETEDGVHKPGSCETVGSFIDILNEGERIGLQRTPPLSSVQTSIDLGTSQKPVNNETAVKESKFPDIENCIPRWKQIFPWVCWSSEDNVLFCIHCRELLRKYFPDKLIKSNVIHITSSEKIFTVAKALRSHHDSFAHTATIYLYSYGNLVSFMSLFNNHYKDLRQEDEVLEAVRSIFNYTCLKKEGFVLIIKRIGQFIENRLVDSLKESKYFSVVADQCRGILILRWINEKGFIVEHVFWSYLSEWSMTPMQYLKQFGLSFNKMTLYIANSLCQQCSRCQNLSVMPASLPPRPPSTISFANILWNLDFLRPLTSLMNTILKLLKAYPYKFAKRFEVKDLKQLYNYSVNPTVLINVMENFDVIKSIAFEIYNTRSYVEALGLSMVDLKKDEHHKKILTLLQEIIDTVKEASVGPKIKDSQIVKLNQAFGSLKTWSVGANFVTHKNLPPVQSINTKTDKIWEFLYFVEKFIDENQKSIYYNGRNRVRDFMNICCTNILKESDSDAIDDGKLFKHFSTVYDVYTQVLKANHAFGKMRILKCVRNFHNYCLQNKIVVNTCVDILQEFHREPKLQKEFPDAYEMFLFCSTMPFQSCQIARSLFVCFVCEQRVESSAWARMESDLKPWLLYMQNELSFIPPQSLLKWWLQSLSEGRQKAGD